MKRLASKMLTLSQVVQSTLRLALHEAGRNGGRASDRFSLDQPTCTPFQKAMRPRIFSALALGSG